MTGWVNGAGCILLMLALFAGGCASSGESNLSALHYFRKGNAAFQAEDFRRAINHYQRAIEFDDSAPELYYNLGLAYYRVRSFDQAVEAYQEAVDRDPSFADAHHNLALAYDKQYNLEAAHRHFNLYRDLVAKTTSDRASPSGKGSGADATATPARMTSQPSAAPQGKGSESAKARNTAAPHSKGSPSLRQGGAPSPKDNPFEGNGKKWWNVDPAQQNR